MNLATAKSTDRAKEVGMRKMLGARKHQLFSQFIGESLIITLIAIILAILALAPMSALAGESIDQSWDLNSDASISIENIAGEVIILAWDKNEARLTGKLGDSGEELEVSASKTRLQINVANRKGRNIDGTDLKLMVPITTSVFFQ